MPGAYETLELSPDERLLAAGHADWHIALFDADTLEPRGALEGHSEHVRGLAFAPDGTRLASASFDGTVRIWHPAWRSQLLVLHGHSIYAMRVAWSDDRTTLVSAGGDWFPEACALRTWSVR